jgi:hypothetical protein
MAAALRQMENRIAALERVGRSRGWHPIGAGDTSALTVTVPAGVERVRCFWQAANSVTAYLRVRVNNDLTGGLHIRSTSLITPAGSFSDTRDGQADTTYLVGSFLNVLPSWGTYEIDLTNPRAFMMFDSRRAGIPTGTARFLGHGNLNADRTVTSLVFSVNAGSLGDLEWRAEGYFG